MTLNVCDLTNNSHKRELYLQHNAKTKVKVFC